MTDEHPACIHCGRPVRNTVFASWWDIGETSGWVCANSLRGDSIITYRKIRERLRKGLIEPHPHGRREPRVPEEDEESDLLW